MLLANLEGSLLSVASPFCYTNACMGLSEARRIIQKIFKADQTDRSSARWKRYSDRRRLEIIARRDARRRKKLTLALSHTTGLRGIDYFLAGFVMQHGTEKSDIEETRRLAKKSYALGYQPGKWLYAAATDRLLIMAGKPQRFGTQLRKTPQGKWEIAPLDHSTTDRVRRRHRVMSLQKINLIVNKINGAGGSKLLRRIGLTLLRH